MYYNTKIYSLPFDGKPRYLYLELFDGPINNIRFQRWIWEGEW